MSRSILLGASFVVLLLAGCQILPEPTVDITRHYVLAGPASAEATAVKPTGRYLIGIRSIDIPAYLHDHRDIAVRTAANEIRFDEVSCWAESLEDGIARVLKQRLLAMDSINGVSTFPFAADVRRDFDVVVTVINCEGVVSGGHGVARFVASYDILAAGAGGQVVVRRSFTAPELPWDGKDFGSLASSLSESVARLGEDIAANLPK